MNSVILQVRELRWQRYTRVQKCHPAYAFVEALVVVRSFDPIQSEFTCIALIDSNGRAVRCNLRNSVFNIPQGETHILRLAGMCSLYCGFCFTPSLSVLSLSSDWFSYYCPKRFSVSAFASNRYLPDAQGPKNPHQVKFRSSRIYSFPPVSSHMPVCWWRLPSASSSISDQGLSSPPLFSL